MGRFFINYDAYITRNRHETQSSGVLLPTGRCILSIYSCILIKLFKFRERKYFLVRPLLTILIFIFIVAIANWTYRTALEQAATAAKIIHDECNKNLICPVDPDGWKAEGTRISKDDFGIWLNYSASYNYDKNNFLIKVYQGPDLGDNISGGINLFFKVERYIENQ